MVTIIAHIVPEELSAVEIKIGLGVAFCENCDESSGKGQILCCTCASELHSCLRAAVLVMPRSILGKLV